MFLLADLGQHGGTNCLRLRLLDGGWCSVMYRHDLDGAIELSPQDERAEVPNISVCAPRTTSLAGYIRPVRTLRAIGQVLADGTSARLAVAFVAKWRKVNRPVTATGP